MNIEDYREYCLSLGADVEEKLPFQKFKAAKEYWYSMSWGTCSHSSTAMTFQSSH